MIYEISKKIFSFVKYLIDKTCLLFKLKETRIVLESASDYADSSKTFFDFLIANKYNSKYHIVWLVEDVKQFRKKVNIKNISFYPKSPTKYHFFGYVIGKIIADTSKYCLYTHNFVGNPLNKNQIRVFITHASPPVKNSKGNFWDPSMNTIILSTSNFAAKYRCKTFGGGEDRVNIIGLPRNDDLFVIKEMADKIKKQLNIPDNMKIIVWLPTFKHHKAHGRNDFKDKNKNDDLQLFTNNYKKIERIMEANNSVLIIKLHPGQDKTKVNIKDSNHVKFLENRQLTDIDINLYKILGISDAIITDFSSVYFDYLLLGRPIAFDLSEAKAYGEGVGFIFNDVEKYMPGQKIKDIFGFEEFVNSVANNNDEFCEEREKLMRKNHKYIDNKSCERLINVLGISKGEN